MLAQVQVQDNAENYLAHPALLDGCLQAAGLAIASQNTTDSLDCDDARRNSITAAFLETWGQCLGVG